MSKVMAQPQTASVEVKMQVYVDFLTKWYFLVDIEILKFILGRLVTFHKTFKTPN